MDSLWASLIKLNHERDSYIIKSGPEKTFLWDLLINRLNKDETILQDFQLDRVAVYLIYSELALRKDLMATLPEEFLGHFYKFLRLRLRNREELIRSKKIIKDYGVDFGVEIKVNAINELDKVQETAQEAKRLLQQSKSPKTRLKAIMS